MLIYVFPPHYQLVCANSYTSSFSLISYMSTRDALRQYSQWITPVFAMDYSSTCGGLLQYSQ